MGKSCGCPPPVARYVKVDCVRVYETPFCEMPICTVTEEALVGNWKGGGSTRITVAFWKRTSPFPANSNSTEMSCRSLSLKLTPIIVTNGGFNASPSVGSTLSTVGGTRMKRERKRHEKNVSFFVCLFVLAE